MESRVDLEEPRYDRLVFPDTVPRVEMVARRNLRTRGESSCVRRGGFKMESGFKTVL